MLKNSEVFAVLLLLRCFSSFSSSPLYVCTDENCNHECQNMTSCHTLSYYAITNSSSFNTSHIEIIFLPGLHFLNASISFVNLQNVSLKVQTDEVSTEIKCLESNIGFFFKNVTDLSIHDLIFTECGQQIESAQTAPEISNPRASLFMEIIINLSLTRIMVQNSSGYGVFLSQIYGKSSIKDCTFQYNSGSDLTSDGGNAVLMYQTQEGQSSVSAPASVTIEKSRFLHGHSFKYAAGLLLILYCSGAQVDIVESEIYGNQAESNSTYCLPQNSSFGGNLALILHNYNSALSKCASLPSTTNIAIRKSNITLGKACTGGGMFAKFTSTNETELNPTVSVSLTDVTLKNNIAWCSGAAVFIQLNSQESHKNWSRVLLRRCSLVNNQLKTDSLAGVAMTVASVAFGTYHSSPQLIISECQFSSNYLDSNGTKEFASAFFASQCMDGIQIKGGTVFEDNGVTAISLLHSSLSIDGEVTVTRNTGNAGGGIALLEVSYLILAPSNTTLTLSHNQAHQGGGIFVEDRPLMLPNEPCFYQINGKGKPEDLKSVRIVLANNTAHFGSQIFGGRVESCRVQHTGHSNFFDLFVLPIEDRDDLSMISSKPEKVHFCYNGSPDLNASNATLNHSVWPYKNFHVSVALTGQYGGITHGSANFSIANPSLVTTTFKHMDSYCETYAVKILTNRKVELIDIKAVASHGQYSSKQLGGISLRVNILPTPLGFVYTRKQQSNPYRCIQYPNLTASHFTCEIYGSEGIIKRVPPYWLGYSSQMGFTLYHYCPSSYCHKNITWIPTNSTDFGQNRQCADDRSGVLCGRCKSGLSLSLGSASCLNCSHISTAGAIGISLGLASIGVLLIFVLYCLKVTATQGILSGFHFYVNVIFVYWAVLLPNFTGSFVKFLYFFIASANLVFGCDCCLYNGLDVIGRTWLQFMLVIYLWILVGVIILAGRYFKWVNQWIGDNTVPVLATIILLSHTSLSLAVIHALSWADLTYHDLTRNNTVTHTKVLLYDGNIAYLSPRHIPLFIAGCVMGAISVSFTILLLCVQPLQKYSGFVLLKWVNKLKPVLDAFTHPHIIKSKYRFWNGYLLLARSVIYVMYATNIGHDNKKSLNVLSLVTLMILLTLLCLGGIYIKRHLNVFFSFHIINLFVLSIVVNDMYPHRREGRAQSKHIGEVTCIFTSLSVLAYLGSMIHIGYHHVKDSRFCIFMRKVCAYFKSSSSSRHGYRAMESCVRNSNYSTISTSSSFSTHQNNIHPPLSITYREPQLRDYDSI